MCSGVKLSVEVAAARRRNVEGLGAIISMNFSECLYVYTDLDRVVGSVGCELTCHQV